jgi:hypothetical protein
VGLLSINPSVLLEVLSSCLSFSLIGLNVPSPPGKLSSGYSGSSVCPFDVGVFDDGCFVTLTAFLRDAIVSYALTRPPTSATNLYLDDSISDWFNEIKVIVFDF